jgi:hypothetical protein
MPKCNVCSDVRFSLKGLLAQPIEKTARRRLGGRRLDKLTAVAPPGASAIGLNSTARSLFGPGSRNGNSLLLDQDSLFRFLGNSVKKQSDLAGFELIQRLDRPQKRGIPCIFP